MIRRPPRSTRTDTLFPYTTLFRSAEKREPIVMETGSVGQAFNAKIRRAPFNTTRPTTVPITKSRSEEHTSELQSLMRISYAVFCLKKKNKKSNYKLKLQQTPSFTTETSNYKNTNTDKDASAQ